MEIENNIGNLIWYKSLFLPRVAEFIYIEGDNKRVVSRLQLIYRN